MSHDLRRSLADLARAGSAETTPPTEVVRTTSDIVDRRRRRRPVMIATVTAVSVLTAGAAAAAVYSATRDDASAFPDRPPVTQSADPTPTPAPSSEAPVPSSAPSVEPTPTEPVEVEEPAPPAPTLAVLDPAATFPQCGAAPVTTPGSPVGLSLEPQSPGPSEGAVSGIEVRAVNRSVMQLTAEVVDPTLVLVQDGRVVGSLAQPGATSVVSPLTNSIAMFSGDVATTGCVPGTDTAVPLPGGYYEVWAQQGWTVLDKVLEPQEYLRGPVTEVPDTFTASDLVGGLWIGDDGQPSTGPARADGWPAPVEWSYAFPGGVAIVWFALGDTPQEVLDATVAVESLGYDGRPILVGHCPADPSAALGRGPSTLGVGVVFADRASAESFVALSGAQVLGIVETEPTCPGG